MRTTSTLERPLLLLILLAYLAIGGLYALLTPDWQSPDEPAHYNYVAQVAADGCCPVIQPGDWNLGYLNQLTSARFAPQVLSGLSSVQYEDHQPPLYYVLASVIHRLTGGSLTALRLFSVLIGLGVVLCVYGVGRTLLPERPQVTLGAAALVAFIPQHLHILASVNNDGMAELVVGLALLLCVLYVKGLLIKADDDSVPGGLPRERLVMLVWIMGGLGLVLAFAGGGVATLLGAALLAGMIGTLLLVIYDINGDAWVLALLGLLVGVGLVTKASTYFLAALVPLAVLLRWLLARPQAGPVESAVGSVLGAVARTAPAQSAARTALRTETGRRVAWALLRRWLRRQFSRERLGDLARRLALVLLPALLLGAVWWLRNFSVYGLPDFLGLAAHDAVVADQPRTWQYINQWGSDRFVQEFLATSFSSFWARFGWMAVPVFDAYPWFFALTAGLLLAAFSGLLLEVVYLRRQRGTRPPGQYAAWLLLWVTLGFALLAYLYYNTEFYQPQARYMYVGLIPFALLVACGLEAWRRVLFGWAERQTSRGTLLLRYLPALLLLVFAPLSLWLLWFVLVPNLSP